MCLSDLVSQAKALLGGDKMEDLGENGDQRPLNSARSTQYSSKPSASSDSNCVVATATATSPSQVSTGDDRSLPLPQVAPATVSTLHTVSPLLQDDWTKYLPPSEHVRFFRETNWAGTPLGPLNSWGLALRLHTFTVLADSLAACLYCKLLSITYHLLSRRQWPDCNM